MSDFSTCRSCGGTILPGQGHNPAPLRKDGVCCAGCNDELTIKKAPRWCPINNGEIDRTESETR